MSDISLCMSSSTHITHSREAPLSSPLTTHLLVEQDDDHGICHEFLTEIIFRFPEDDSARDAMMGAIEDLGRQVASMSMNDNYKPYVLVSTWNLSSIYNANMKEGFAKFSSISSDD